MSEQDKQNIAERVSEKMNREDRIATQYGIRVDHIEPGAARLSLTVSDAMINGHGTCHGGVIFTLADIAFAHACNSYNNTSVGYNCDITYINPGQKGDVLTAECGERHRRGRSGIYDVDVSNQDGVQIAIFRGHSRALGTPFLKE